MSATQNTSIFSAGPAATLVAAAIVGSGPAAFKLTFAL